MKFQNQQNEYFWENISKFDLSGETFRVLCAWVIDVPETHPTPFFPAISIIMKRTGIKYKQQVSRAYKDLVERGILEEIETKGSTQAYKLNSELLEKGFQPPNFEPVELNDEEESPEQIEYENSVIPPDIHAGIGKNQRIHKNQDTDVKEKIQKEAAAKKKRKYPGWDTFFSESQNEEVSVQAEERENGFLVRWCRGNPKTDRTSIPPQDVIEEFCREVLNIEDPMEIYRYMYAPYQDDFLRKYNLKRPE